MSALSIVWFRRDLRLRDQAALVAACRRGAVIPLFILDDETPRHRRMGAASRWWLHHSLAALAEDLNALGSRLILRRGRAADVLAEFSRETGATEIHALRHYEPWWRSAEKAIGADLNLVLHDGNYLHPPGLLTTGSGKPYQIFTPFWRALQMMMPPPQPLPAPRQMAAPEKWPASDQLEDWQLLPRSPDWAAGFAEEWRPGEQGARNRLEDFVPIGSGYEDNRNLPSIEGSSRLSPHLHFGEISPATVWHAIGEEDAGRRSYLRELGWRDFAQNVILERPDYGRRNGRAQFDSFPWRDPVESLPDLERWKQGLTGYPIVDAGMRELWHTGWMHNRVRMIAASFLIKHLLIDWREGEQWFWDTLVDADYANNAVNWQWTAGTGTDSNMFVRIMAPLSQSEKFNAGSYIRRWVPELAHFSDRFIHDPEEHGMRPATYPPKLIDHRVARARALAAFDRMKG